MTAGNKTVNGKELEYMQGVGGHILPGRMAINYVNFRNQPKGNKALTFIATDSR
jgi:hypothetical protein